MKNSHFYLPCLTVVTAILLAGCQPSGIANRIGENSSSFAALTSDQQEYIRDAIVFPGDTTEMAYIALGKPTSIESKERNGDTVEMWTYKKYYPSGQLADFLTKYSRERNPNLQRELSLETGKAIGGGTGGGNSSSTGVGTGFGAHGSATQTEGTMDPLSLPDLPVYNLYVFIYEGRVTDVKIESIDQTTFMWLEEATELEKNNPPRETHQ